MRRLDLCARSFGRLGWLPALALTLAACDRAAAPLDPDPDLAEAVALRAEIAEPGRIAQSTASQSQFYPLELGNHWGHERVMTFATRFYGEPPRPPNEFRERTDRDHVCIESLGGRDYVVERQTFSTGVFPLWWRLRQDGAGLYYADVPPGPPACAGPAAARRVGTDAAGEHHEAVWAVLSEGVTDEAKQVAVRAAWDRLQLRTSAIRQALALEPWSRHGAADRGGVQPGEVTQLEYPLRVGAAWELRDDPFRVEYTVEAAETLELAVGRVPAWRIRLSNEGFGPEDRAHVWFGRSGFLKLVTHFETPVIDIEGNQVGITISDDRDELVEVSLRNGRFASR